MRVNKALPRRCLKLPSLSSDLLPLPVSDSCYGDGVCSSPCRNWCFFSVGGDMQFDPSHSPLADRSRSIFRCPNRIPHPKSGGFLFDSCGFHFHSGEFQRTLLPLNRNHSQWKIRTFYLGGSTAADLLLWKRALAGVSVLFCMATAWFLFEQASYSFLSSAANVILISVVILFLWAKSAVLLSSSLDQSDTKQENGMTLFNIEGPDSGIFPFPVSLACISYGVSLVREGSLVLKESLETRDDFEFEIGVGAVIHQLEASVTQLSVNQSAQFITKLPAKDLILVAAGDCAESFSLLSFQGCFLEYSVKLLGVIEPLEDRMEQALFSPPLSKQRVEYALRHIHESHATSLVDFGCGSGSLLDSLLEHSTSLETIVGVDISQRSLCRAAKLSNMKLAGEWGLFQLNLLKNCSKQTNSKRQQEQQSENFRLIC